MNEVTANTTNGTKGIGRIQRVKLREVWGHEALDFTTWLEENIDVLADATGLQLSAVEREQSVGAFSVDLIAQDQDGRAVVIENQLKKSDHDHLGKLLTYLVGLQAPQAVWIVADPRPEHVRVIAWLNESSSADFYLLKLEAIQIGNSERAPLLTQIVGPSEETRAIGETKTILVERQRLRLRFFEGLLEHAKSKTQLHANISPSIHGWVGAGSGIAGLTFNYVIREREARVELYIDTPDGEKNQSIFETFSAKKEQIEVAFSGPLEWDTKEGRRACRIQKTFATGGYRDEDKWEAVYAVLAEGMVKLESAFRTHLKRIKSL
ncbi:MAG: DUF4268 domain-containing protein [Acidobacteriia bacterium]|nr:DUF4268 domain-containing protein [Terriglobia bacterium]MYG00864.1 DUF4268 domain-containing protein [Terriglobia bacterium]MYK09061.1 DUF4268 domain-containing protein [Terriglobia bacterium]